ncbi:MAG: hypothetical protein OXC61_04780 [Flavobacteriaceae bacterium]|nr:hypothetical protein [Flavobacteriaceae bacterium]
MYLSNMKDDQLYTTKNPRKENLVIDAINNPERFDTSQLVKTIGKDLYPGTWVAIDDNNKDDRWEVIDIEYYPAAEKNTSLFWHHLRNESKKTIRFKIDIKKEYWAEPYLLI